MKIVTMMSGVITLLLMLSAMICGLWLKSDQPGSIDFHIGCGIASVVFCCITLILLAITLRHMKKGT